MVQRPPPPPMVPHADYLASLPRKRVITSALVVDEDQLVLCVEPTYKNSWHLPGGTVEQGESPSDACLRECTEELGISIALGRLLAVGHLDPGVDDHHGALAFVYEASMRHATIDTLVLADDEIRSAAWLDGHQMQRTLSPLALRFVLAGMDALTQGTLVELDRCEDPGALGIG